MKKDVSIQIIRILSLFMIITCHILQALNNSYAYWLNIGVQIFLIISGFLYANKHIDSLAFYKKRIIKIIKPLIILIVIIVIISKIFLDVKYTKLTIIANILGFGGSYGTIQILSHTWFITYILLCYLITPIIQHIYEKNNVSQGIKLNILLMIILQMFQYFYVINIKMAWIICYILGYMYGKIYNNKHSKKVFKVSILILTLMVLPFAIIYQEGLNVSLPTLLLNNKTYIIDYSHVFLGLLIFILLYDLFIKLNLKSNVVVDFFDKYSFCIYLVHQIFIFHELSIFNLTNYLSLNIIMVIGASIIAGVLLYHINELITIERLSVKKHANVTK